MPNNFDLDRALKAAKLPERSTEYWEEFPQRVIREVRRPITTAYASAPHWMPHLAWGLALVIAGIAIGMVFASRRASQPNEALLQNVKVIQETLAMFPNRVRAIVMDEHGMKLVLSDAGDVPSSPPLWVRCCDGGRCVSFVTFSGQEVEVGGQRITALADPRGDVLLMGKDFAWSSATPNGNADGLKLEAKVL